jgi:hypothetical protein
MAGIQLRYRTRDQRVNEAKAGSRKYKLFQADLDEKIDDLDAFIEDFAATFYPEDSEKEKRCIYKWIITRDCETNIWRSLR